MIDGLIREDSPLGELLRKLAKTEEIKREARRFVDESFKSFFDPDFNKQLTRILPQLEA